MDVLAGPFAIVVAVLVVGGVFKLADPVPTQTMLARVGVPARPGLGRLSGAVEVMAGSVAFVVGGRLGGAIVAVAFLAFSVITARLLQIDSSASCGCFGRHSTPATPVHLGANVLAAALGLAVLAFGLPSLTQTLGEVPAAGVPFLALVALGTWLFVATLTVLPETLVAARRTPAVVRVREFEIRSRPSPDR